MLLASVLTALVAVVVCLLPFVVGEGGSLRAAASINSIEKLEAIKQAILKRYIEDETTFEKNALAQVMWQQRRQYLVNRYVDASRRLDYLRYVEQLESSES